MTVCVTTSSLGTQWFYPVADPYRTAGPGPYYYGYPFAWDDVLVTVTPELWMPRCKMDVELSFSLPDTTREIQAFNLYNDTWHAQIDSDPPGGVKSMTIEKRKPGQACSVGTDTIVLATATDLGPKALYTFPPIDFWDCWGGCTVRFTWVAAEDYWRRAWGPSGADFPAPTYPAVRLPDGTLMRNAAGTGVSVVFGGTDFPVGGSEDLGISVIETSLATARAVLEQRDLPNVLGGASPTTRNLLAGAIPYTQLPPIPADFTLVREWNRPEVYVVFGGAKFSIPDEPTLFALGFDWSMVRVIPAGGASKLRHIPIDRTLVKEQHDSRVYVVDGQKLRLVDPPEMDFECLPFRHVRVVPDGGLSAMPIQP
jgi:hypothetical protein